MKKYAAIFCVLFPLGMLSGAAGQTWTQQLLPITGLPPNNSPEPSNIIGIGADSAANIYFLDYNHGVYEAPRSTTSYNAAQITTYTVSNNNPQLWSLSVTSQGIPYWSFTNYTPNVYANVAAGTNATGVVNLPDPPGAPTFYADIFPMEVAVNFQGTTVYASSFDNKVYAYYLTLNPNGTPANWQISGPANFASLEYHINSMAVDPNNSSIFYLATQDGRLFQADMNGDLVQIPVTGLQGGCTIAVDAGGDIYLADYTGAQIVEVSPSNGSYTQQTIETGTAVDFVAANPSELVVYGLTESNTVLVLTATRSVGGGPKGGGGGNQ